jgi:scyllo-inositol 2-dehydrogenase (NADP+)
VDLLVLATPHSVHAEQAIRAMSAGKHVVVDKVMALNLAQCDAMIAAAEKNGVVLNVFQNRRFDGDYLTVRKLIDEGVLGSVRWVEMAWQGFRAQRGWRGQAVMGGGRLYDLGAHLIDQVCMLFPTAVQSVYCRMQYDHEGSDVESEAFVVMTFAGGTTAVCDVSGLAAIAKPRFHVRGTAGAFRKYGIDPQEAAMKAGDIDGAVEDPSLYGTLSDGTTARTVPTVAGRWRTYYENIAAVLNQGAEPAVKLAEVRREIAVIDAARRSAESGEVVKTEIAGLEQPCMGT